MTDEPGLTQAAAASIRHPLTLALLTLTFTTGVIDAATFLGLGRVFTANMTGNVILLGFGIAGAGGLPVLAPIVSLSAFLIGALFGGVLAAKLGERHPAHVGASLLTESLLIALAALYSALVGVHAGSFSGDVVIALLAFALGVRNATVQRINVPDLTTTVLTRTLTALAASSPLAGGTGKGSLRRVAAVTAMLAGAVTGALLLKSSLTLALACASALAFVTLVAYVPPRWRSAREPA